ncbi:dithiol-disulfide isomerase [Kurthia sp. 3B1D]|uniref:ClpXP adapter protein SpxH n=2 Tax=Kurthia TaxID=1649 RepID=A0A433RTN9_9BACL|nr:MULTISPECIES: DsbA family protein [unclassified Kurthia]RUS55530.1 dithiol-disulfide isomerase [Kurthia sp. 3B1D]HIX42191.1 DsbA family protein [Candidatus Kurthia intestinigallinarum]
MANVQFVTEQVAPSTTSFNKPIELYVFVDLLHPGSWHLQSTIRRLQVRYGHYFTLRFILSTELASLNTACQQLNSSPSDSDLIDVSHPVLPSIAVKAAELQGKKAGYRFLMKLQEYAMINAKNVCSCSTLNEIAEQCRLDMMEFKSDFRSMEATRAFQSDLCVTREMEVNEVPSFVFFNENIEDEGLKVSGSYDFEVYEHILEEMVDEQLIPTNPPELEILFKQYQTLSTEEVAAIYNIPEKLAERELKKRMLQQKISRLACDSMSLWQLK